MLMVRTMTNISPYIFRECELGLEFVGNFEGLYQADPDPWNQSGEDEEYRQYYNSSRARLIGALRKRLGRGPSIRGLEVGCGHGHVAAYLADMLDQQWSGVDISPTAIAKAQQLYPKQRFFVGDIIKGFNGGLKYDVVVLCQILWYVMHRMDVVVANCLELLTSGGLLVISQAFLTEHQLYGTEIADGFNGALKMMLEYSDPFQIIDAHFEYAAGLAHHDGLIVMKRRR